jgi:hypothetical protein
VARPHLAAFLALPFFLLVREKRLHPPLLDEFKVGDHAHVVFCAVARIQVLQQRAREQLALVAILLSPTLQLTAVFYPAVDTAGIFVFAVK